MKNPLVKLTSNEDDNGSEWGASIYISALYVQGITPGELIYESDNDEKSRRTSGTGEQPMGRGARVYFSGGHHCVRESVDQCVALFEAQLKSMTSKS